MFAYTRNVVPSGSILLWSGSIASIPAGFALCNGSNGTPDLRDKFIVGAKQDVSGVAKTNVSGSLTQTGGTIEHLHSIGELAVFEQGDFERHSWPETGLSSHIPPYYALAYIMKL